jgi:hypothetical protein
LTLVFVLVCAVTGYFWYAYAGPFKWIAELQLSLLGEYELNITLIGTFLSVFVPVALIGEIPWVKRRFDTGPMTEEEISRAGKLFDENTVIPWWPLVIGTICLITGLVMLIPVWTMGSLTAITAAEAEGGVSPRSGWVDASGYAMGSRMIGLREGTPSKLKNSYVPLVSSEWQPGTAVKIYVRLDDEKMLSDGDLTLRGRVASGLPGMIRESFARTDAPPAEDHWVLENDFNPEFNEPFGKGALWVAGIAYAVALVLFLLYRSANKRGGWRG